jgi:4-amino-4-deoxy-L-arabinose transferase-like glycosyltransferase
MALRKRTCRDEGSGVIDGNDDISSLVRTLNQEWAIGNTMRVFSLNWRHTSFLVFLLAFLVRGAFILTQQDGFYFPDSLMDSQTAVKLLSAGEFGADFGRAPGYPVFLAAVYWLFGESILAIRVVESFMGAFLAIVMAALGRRVGGEIVGILAGIMWAVYPMGIFIAGLVYPTALAVMLLACGVWCMLPARQEELSGKGVFSGGVFLGLAALTIPVALLTIIVAAAWVFYWARQSRLFLALLLFLGAGVTIVPWTARDFLVRGQLVPVQSDFERYLYPIVTAETHLQDNGVNPILLRLELYAVHFGRNFVGFWELYPSRIQMSDQGYRNKLHAKDSQIVKETIYSPNQLINAVSILSVGPIFLCALLGTVAMWLRRDRWRELSLLWVMVLSFAVGYAVFVGKIRYRVPVEPYLIILSAYGVHAAYAVISARFKSVAVPSGSIRRST